MEANYQSREGLGNEEAEMEAELLRELNEMQGASGTGYNAYEDAGGRIRGVKESVNEL